MDISEIVKVQNTFFHSGKTKDIKYRKEALKKLFTTIEKNEKNILEALYSDLNKSETEGYMTEISTLKEELSYVLKHMSSWAKKTKTKTALSLFPAKCYKVSDPFGVVLIMSPWNYPLLLSLEPLVGAIAAGNCAVLKPSAYAPKTSDIIEKIITECFPPEYCAVVKGGRKENDELLKQKFDYIFFTGSPVVGKAVMEAAAQNLTPISLELGGKSPVIVDESADMSLTAKRLVFGKFINSGQTCIAPDYLFIHESKKDELINQLEIWIKEFYPKDEMGKVKDYPKIINQKHFDRLIGLLEGENVVLGGKYFSEDLKIEPTILTEVKLESPIMQEEIFGPILPIIAYNKIEEVIKIIKDRPKPLALYLFSNDKNVQKRILSEISFGGGCINDTILHVASSHLPFGGVGNSGMGSYHGKASFDTFTHYKSIVHKSNWMDFSFRYRPYDKNKQKLIRTLLK